MKAGTPPSSDIGLTSLATLDKDRSLATCMGCHALKTRLAPGYTPGAALEAYYSVTLAQLGDTPYTPDGRTRTFAYQEGHFASDCYRNGGMTCTSCHDPHTQGYRTVDGTPIPGRFDDRQCTSCHASKAENPAAHTKHPAGSPGSQCVACHMPYDQQHELGRAIRYQRSDHTIAIPRPALDRSLGLTGACQGCHTTLSTTALDAQVTRWWGSLKPHDPAVAGALAARDDRSLASAAPSLLVPESRHVMAQMAGLSALLDRLGAEPAATLSNEAETRLRRLAESPDLDVRATALATLHLTRGSTRGVRRLLTEAITPVAKDDKVALRSRWAVVLGGIGDEARTAGRHEQAVTAYRAALEVAPGYAPLLVNLGLALAARNDWAGAVRAYQQALQTDPRQPLTEVNLGIALEGAGDPAGADAAYRRAIAADPTHPLGYLNLGTLRLRNEQAAEARPWLEQALARDPGLATGHFQLALTLLQAGDLAGAERAVRRSLALDSTNGEAVKLSEALREARSGK
jgi:tetratricopeptide (TPR) repeat protein